MYGQLVRVIWECKRFLNWLVSIRNWPKLFATRYKINKYKVLHIVLYASYAYKNKNRTMSFQSFQLNCPAADLFCRFRNLKNKEGVYWGLLYNFFLERGWILHIIAVTLPFLIGYKRKYPIKSSIYLELLCQWRHIGVKFSLKK